MQAKTKANRRSFGSQRSSNRVKIKAINMVKRHVKPTKENKGGIISKEAFIHQSNLNIIKKKEKVITKK